ncbi:MAG: DUF177 domain-containing protein [Gemmatimonadaceae bacterium]|nr:DUF177 domain-containing protein [Acetobacteraceae bacterium]
MMPELHRPLPVERIGPQGLSFSIEASAAELAPIADRLRLLAIKRLTCMFDLRRVGATTIIAQGTLRAQVTEMCVVTLDSFDHAVHETFAVHFVPSGTETDDPEPDDVDQVPIVGSTIDLGEALVEQLALSLDPYPRKPGASMPAGYGEAAAGPFGALLALRRPD